MNALHSFHNHLVMIIQQNLDYKKRIQTTRLKQRSKLFFYLIKRQEKNDVLSSVHIILKY